MIFRRRSVVATAAALALVLVAGACSSPSRSATSTTTPPAPSSTDDTTSTTTPAAAAIVFTTVDGAIDAYTAEAPFTRQRVVAAGTAGDGSEPHGQICFDPDGTRRFVVAESTPAAGTAPASAGWGLYQLTGDQVGGLRVRRIAGWTSPSGTATDAPTTYGCAFLSDGRLLTTDVGNQRGGAATGRLIEWFPPFDTAPPTSCTLSTTLATPLGLSADGADNVYLAAARAPGAGVWRFSGVYPNDAGSCVTATVGNAPPNTTTTTEPGSSPSTTVPPTTVAPTTTPGPTATHGPGPSDPASPGPAPDSPSTVPATGPPAVTATLVVPPAPGPASAPTSVAVSPDAKSLLVASAPFGTITAYGIDGTVQAAILSDPSKAVVGGTAFAGGTPLGLAIAPDSSLFYVDTGLVAGTGGIIAPAPRGGSVRKVATQPGFESAPAPVTMNTGLAAPDGIGVYAGTNPQSGGASIA